MTCKEIPNIGNPYQAIYMGTVGMQYAEFKTKINEASVAISRFKLFMRPNDYAILATKIDLNQP